MANPVKRFAALFLTSGAGREPTLLSGDEPTAPLSVLRAVSRLDRYGPPAIVLAVTLLSLVEQWPQTAVVAYPNDCAMHSEMVRFAAHRFAAGHFPLNEWFPYLNVGSPHFLHYQSLPAMITGAVGLAFGADRVFAWSQYLLLATWPVSVFLGGRLLRLSPWAAAAAAAASPFLVSAPGLGYEQGSYLWIGFGLWTQLWGMWALPLAWGFAWRAVSEGRSYLPAVLAVSLTMAFHFMTGYLAVLPVVLFALVRPGAIARGLLRAAAVLAGAFGTSAWVVFPLIRMSRYAAVNEFLRHTSHANSFGARRILSWLAEGMIFDNGRGPVITVFVALGVITAIVGSRRNHSYRGLLAVFVVSLVLFFGRPTLGAALDALPGNEDLFLRRFVMGVQLSGLYLAGIGTAAFFPALLHLARRRLGRLATFTGRPGAALALRLAAVAAGAAALSPAIAQLSAYDASNARQVHSQQLADANQGREIDALIARVGSLPPGRVYAGLPVSNWGSRFHVGEVTVLQYLASRDVDEIGFTLRTASLMSNPEAYFSQYEIGDYKMFGVRYLILPRGHQPSVPARELMRRGLYTLWAVPGVKYLQMVATEGTVQLNRADVGRKTASFVRSLRPTEGVYPTVAFGGAQAARPTASTGAPPGSPGTVQSERANLSAGQLSARVVARRPSVALLSASYDPGWTAKVDGRAVGTEMVAPALVGVPVPPGHHRVTFTFRGMGGYPVLFGTAAFSLAAVVAGDAWNRRRLGHLAQS